MSTYAPAKSVVRTTNVQLFLNEVECVIGSENVVKDGNKVRELSADPVYTTIPPVAYVYPRSTAEVTQIVRAANKFSVSIWPYSTGKNWGYCNTTGGASSVVVILNKMNRILHVDYELAYAEIEPGVTYEQLNSYLNANKIGLWTDCTGGPPSGSVIGNALDRGIGVTPYGDHFANLCGLEAVLPNGRVIHTGGFREDAQGAWHTYKWGIGPSLEGLFAQSNYGIVTKAGIWLMREPQDFVVGAIKIEDENRLAPALDAFRELMLSGVLPEKARFSNDVAMLTLVTQAQNESLDGQPLTKSKRDSLRTKYRIPRWTGSFGIYGTKGHVRLKRSEAARRLKSLAGLSFAGERRARLAQRIAHWIGGWDGRIGVVLSAAAQVVTGTSIPVLGLVTELVDIHKGIPNESVVRRAYFRYPSQRPQSDINVARDRIGVLWFVPLLPLRGTDIAAYIDYCEKRFEERGFDFYVTIMILNARTAVPLMVILYDLEDMKSCERAKKLYDDLYKDARERGYQQFRCAHPGWEQIYSDLPELKHVHQMLKDALDPNHIIAPGRYGIS